MRTLLSAMICVLAMASVACGQGRVAVLPFDVIGEDGHAWVGRAIQEGMATNLQRHGVAATVVPAVGPIDAAGARAAGRAVDAQWVVFGSVQFNGEQMRVGGQIMPVSGGPSLGTLASDAALTDLFNVEDVLSDRAARLLTPPRPRPTGAHAVSLPTLELVQPVRGGQPRYFQQSIATTLAVRDRFQDEADRYNYHDSLLDPDSCGYWGCGWGGYGCGWGYCGFCGVPFWNGVLYHVATPVSGW